MVFTGVSFKRLSKSTFMAVAFKWISSSTETMSTISIISVVSDMVDDEEEVCEVGVETTDCGSWFALQRPNDSRSDVGVAIDVDITDADDDAAAAVEDVNSATVICSSYTGVLPAKRCRNCPWHLLGDHQHPRTFPLSSPFLLSLIHI